MLRSINHQSKLVHECLDQGESWHCYGFYFQLDLKIAGESIFCFIGDPEKIKTMYDFCSRSKIKINNQEHLLPLGFKTKGIWREWNQPELTIPTVIGKIALAAEPLCIAALESFLVKIELETEVKNLHHKHNQSKIVQIQSAIEDIETQLELFSSNLADLFDRIIKERNLLNSIQDFPVRMPIELTQRNEDLSRLLTQFYQLDLPNYGLDSARLSQIQIQSIEYLVDTDPIDQINSDLAVCNQQVMRNLAELKASITTGMVIKSAYFMIISMTIAAVLSIIFD
jgi:hypothetical protein